jgi:hypothetical protein
MPLVALPIALALLVAAAPAAVADDTAAGGPGGEMERARKARSAAEAAWHLDVSLGGGSAIAFTSPIETGHTFWGAVHFAMDDFAVGLVGFGVYPGSRVQTRFGGFLLDGRWYLVGRRETLAPFVTLALGYSGANALGGRTPPDGAPRWAPEGSPFIAAPGLGLRWGQLSGLFVSAEARVINASHATFSLGAGVAF